MQFQNNYKEAEWSMSKTQGFILNNGFVYTVFFLKYLICTSKSKRPWEQLEAVEGKGWGWVGKNRDLWENMCSALECAKEVGVDAEFTVGKQLRALRVRSVICCGLKIAYSQPEGTPGKGTTQDKKDQPTNRANA